MKLIKIVLPLILFLFFILYIINRVPDKPIDPQAENNILIFTSPTCPHCQTVKEYIDTNNLQNKLPISILDISQNQAYSRLLSRKAEACQIEPNNIGIPFYFYQGTCFQGDQPIIDRLSEMLQ